MAGIDGINGNYTMYEPNKPKEFNSNLDKDAFLKILVTQLKYQDPLEPKKDNEFIGQMAQFSTLEQAQNTNKSIRMNSANNLVNKLIKASYKPDDTTASTEIIGLVEKVMLKDNDIYLTVNVAGTLVDVKYDDVKEVTELESQVEQIYMMNQSMRNITAFNLIGKNVKGTYEEKETVNGVERTVTKDIEGVVTGVRKDGAAIYLTVNDKEVYLEDITEVN